MKLWLLPAVVGLLALTLRADDFELADGTEYHGVRLIRVDPDGLVIVTGEGVTKLKFTALPPKTQKDFGFDPADPQAFSRKMESAEEFAAREEKQRQRSRARRANSLDTVSIAMLRATGRPAHLRVVQILEDGFLASGNVEDKNGQLSPVDEIFVSGDPAGRVKGDIVHTTLYPIALKTYQATTGARKTVPGYVATEKEARRLSLAEPW